MTKWHVVKAQYIKVKNHISSFSKWTYWAVERFACFKYLSDNVGSQIIFFGQGKLNGTNIQRGKEHQRAIINQHQTLVGVGTWFHTEREEAALPLQSCAAGVGQSPGGRGWGSPGSAAPFCTWQWAALREVSHRDSGCWGGLSWEVEEAVRRPEMA